MFVLGFFVDFFFPKRCVSCKSFGSFLCQNCISKIKSVEEKICPMCERASFDGKTHPGCQTRYSLNGLTSFFRYEGPMKNIIHRLKYKPWIADLVKALTISVANKEQFSGFIVVPVPLHPSRERTRGFNQASLIGKTIAREFNLEFKEGILRRVRNTKPQIELKGKERRENIKNAFSVSSNYTQYAIRYVLLVDDVWTTGSTMRTCANVLKS